MLSDRLFFLLVFLGWSTLFLIFAPVHEKRNKWLVLSEDSDQTGHVPLVLSVFAANFMDSQSSSASSCSQRKSITRLIWIFAGRTSCCWLGWNVSFSQSVSETAQYDLNSVLTNEPDHEKMCFMPNANNKGADKLAHTRSLFSAFVVRCRDRMIYLVYISEISRF